MTWTKEPPTKEGWYWWTIALNRAPEPVLVHDGYVQFMLIKDRIRVDLAMGYWHPAEPPALPEGEE